MTEKDAVLNELRVDKDIPDKDGALGKLRIIYDGISVNTWLRPFGLTLKRGQTIDRSKGVELNDNLKNSIRDRAQSANGILGRRHFELGRQELSRHQVLIGRSLVKKAGGSDDSDVTGSGERGGGDGKTRVSCRSALSTCRPGLSPRGDVKRPFTGIGNFRDSVNRPYTAQPQCTVRNSKADLPDLCITQIIGCRGDARICDTRNKQYLVSVHDVRKQATILDDETISFRSISAMKEAYKTRVKSAPVTKHSATHAEDQDCDNPRDQEHAKIAEDRLGLKTPSNSHTTLKRWAFSSGDRERCHTAAGTRSCTLKPLLYSEECDVAHSNGCPQKCKGCFRACLASDEYFENAKSMIPRRGKPGPVPHRKKVSYRLRPALRMAFLEQLSIEEKARHLEQAMRQGGEGHADDDAEAENG
ncbi:uncharacterized protein LOC135488053 [Lineus longissimus]|uniref:uncharacterized protein LOC135488053 n=1 Tax=Lineus longissimus TaxID=88925 RepID=UPI002B4D2536